VGGDEKGRGGTGLRFGRLVGGAKLELDSLRSLARLVGVHIVLDMLHRIAKYIAAAGLGC